MKAFWDKVLIQDDDSCWLWQAAKYQNGYGAFRVPKGFPYSTKMILAHRFAYLLTHGTDSIPESYKVCHSCDMPSCVNPNHLFVGTQSDNLNDMISKNRHSKVRRYQRGETNFSSKVKLEQVLAMRDMYSNGISIADIAKQLNVDRRNVWAIVHRKSWTHV